MALDRVDLQNLAELRLKDAKVLVESGQYDGTYYLIGYAVECGLKALIAARTRQHEFPDWDLAKSAYTHDLGKLLAISGRKSEWDRELNNDADLKRNWNIVKDWSENSRYEAGRISKEVEELYSAIEDPAHGVMSCIKRLW